MRQSTEQDLLGAALVVVLDRCGGEVRIDTTEMRGRVICSEVKFETDPAGKTWLCIRAWEERGGVN